jgi:hypothetical protein
MLLEIHQKRTRTGTVNATIRVLLESHPVIVQLMKDLYNGLEAIPGGDSRMD